MKKSMYKKEKRSAIPADDGIPEKMDSFFEKHEKTFLGISLAAGIIISILMFDCKVSLSGDDCDYIMNAEGFIKHFTYPGGRGALYPIVISPFLVGGLNLILLKSLSAVFIVLSMWFMYKSFRGKIPASVLMPALFIVNLCPYIFFYASHTYSEPFFMLIQSLFIYLFSKYFWNGEQTVSLPLKTDWRKFLLIGLCFLAMGLTRTIGYAVMGAVIVYFCFRKQWKNLLYSFVASGLVFVLFSLVKKIIWPESGAAYNINNYLAKNFYNINEGMEDLPGYIDRLIVNSHVYLSGFLYKFMGFRSSSELPLDKMPVLTVLTYVLFFAGIIKVCKRNMPLLFTGIYAGVMNFACFILLQTLWEQDRLVMIYYPYILLFLLGGVYCLLKSKSLRGFTWIYPLLLVVLFAGTCVHLKVKVNNNLPVLQQNLAGNDLYGLTPDWENFIKMSRYVASDERFKNAVIVSRKPSISYIYTGRNFMGFYNVPSVNISDVVEQGRKAEDENTFLITDMKKMLPGLSPFIQYVLTTKTGGNFSINNERVNAAAIYQIPKPLFDAELPAVLDSLGINYTSDYETFIRQYVDDRNVCYQITSPDSLLKVIKDNHVKYLLLPKIRIYTSQNTGMFVNTIHQYIAFIHLKYPDSFRIIHSIGKEENCELAEYAGP
jgi:hypothetical protein